MSQLMFVDACAMIALNPQCSPGMYGVHPGTLHLVARVIPVRGCHFHRTLAVNAAIRQQIEAEARSLSFELGPSVADALVQKIKATPGPARQEHINKNNQGVWGGHGPGNRRGS